MKKRLRHTVPLFFLLLLVIPFLTGLVLQVAQECLKWKAEERMEEQALISVSIPSQKAVWEKPEKELRIDCRLFDIKFYTVSNGLLTATGFFDEEEAGIGILLTLLPQDKKHNILLQPFLLLQCFMMTFSLFTLFFYGRSSTKLFTFYATGFTSPHPFVLEWPPRD